MMNERRGKDIFLFWGKAETDSSVYHPTVCHMLDVGIVARELIAVQSPNIRHRMLSMFGPAEANGIAFFASLHDIGKISPGFQMKREDLCKPLREVGFNFSRFAEPKHGKVGAYCLPEILEELLGCPQETASVLSQVLAAHHGVFVGYDQVIAGDRKWDLTRRNTVQFLSEIFSIETLEATPTPTTADALIFAGLLTMADWLGSSEEHFPYSGSMSIDIPAYLADRTVRAKALIRELRMGSFVTTEKTFSELFPFNPNPCQNAVLKVTARLQHPMLIVAESPMGTGKTEAAQAAFSLLAARSDLRGMYYALPTQATGNAMFPRMKTFLEKLDVPGRAELHLIHANADLHPEYEELRLNSIEETEGNVVASSWFTARKRGMLAGYGTGTIDQALMAVLKVRHFFLRLYGLSGKLLVLDEVHAYDAYMVEEIYRLIGWLAYCGSSVVLLSATLPRARRQKLLESFTPDVMVGDTANYPCVIGVDATGNVAWDEINGLEESPVIFVPIASSQEEKAGRIIQLLTEKLADGGCAACILNTVSEAQAVYDVMRKGMRDADIILFHSRFTLERRLTIEKQILSNYGKNGTRPPKGIVIATQVLEQSLDVDFDIMVSDLAPIDLLLQRAGRLQRHPNPRPSLLQERVLYILMPDILASTVEFGGSRYVYFPDILSKTALLFTANNSYQALTINLPYGVSRLIEAVYGNEEFLTSPHLQDTLNTWVEERIGTELANMFAAREAALSDVRSCLDDPHYLERLANDNDDERMVSSRLARRNVTIVIMDEGEPLSVRGREGARQLYGKSIISDNIHLVRHFQPQDPPDEWKEVALLRHCQPLMLSRGKTEVGKRTVSYDDDLGLRIIKKEMT